MTINKAFNKHSDTDRLYLPRNRGGRGLICIQDFCDRMCVSTLGYVLQSNNNKTNDLILNLTPENVTQHSRIE